jgi:hypothetical protein
VRGAPRRAAVLALVLCAAAAAALAARGPVLRAAGWALVVQEPVVSADVIVVASDADGPGVLEAVDLVQRGVAARVAVFADPPDAVDREFLRRGVPYEDRAAVSTRQLRALGVAAVERIPRESAGTQAEAQVLPGWCAGQRLGAVVVVSTPDHSRRLRRVLDRAMRGHPTRVIVHPARYSAFDPDRWWQTRDGLRTGLVELQKLLLDVIRHPAP